MYDKIVIGEGNTITSGILNHIQTQLQEFRSDSDVHVREIAQAMTYFHYFNPMSRVLGIPNNQNLPQVDQGAVAWPIASSGFAAKLNGIHRIELWSVEVEGVSFFMRDVTAEYTYDSVNYCFKHSLEYPPIAYGNVFVYGIAYSQAHAYLHAVGGADPVTPASLDMYTQQEMIDEWGDGTGDPWGTVRDSTWMQSIAAYYKMNPDYPFSIRLLTSYGTEVNGELFVCSTAPGV